MATNALNDRFAVPDALTFNTGNGGLTRAVVRTDVAEGEIYLHGAHVTAWTPAGHDPVLWMSSASHFADGKPIRGGVPICFPWFGAKAGDPEAPSHGPARLQAWEVQATGRTDDGGVMIQLGLALAPLAAQFTVVFGKTLQMTLAVTAANTPGESVRFEEALHTYFNVSDVREISIAGLEGAGYLDQVAGGTREPGSPEPIRFDGEVDRVYLGTEATAVIDDPGLQRRIVIDKAGSRATVVWNPHVAKAKRMPDFGDDEWPGMCCVETANAKDAAVTLAPGQTHTMSATLRVERA